MSRVLIVLILLSCLVLAGMDIAFGTRIDRGPLQNDELTEASGLAESGRDSEVLWTHNDSGGDAALYALDKWGEHLGKYFLTGISFRDVEDICSGNGPQPGEKYLYLADIGDNQGSYTQKYIYRVCEPQVNAGQSPEDFVIPPEDIEVISFTYPAGLRYDAETIFIDNATKDIYLVTKRNPDNPYSGNSDIVFKAAYPQSTTITIELEEFYELELDDYQGYGITAGDLSDSGLELLLKTYSQVFYWVLEPGQGFDEIFDLPAWEVHYQMEPQGEALCWSGGAEGYFTCGEEYAGYPSHLAYYPRYSSFIQISELPTGLYKPDEQLQIVWQPPGLYNQLYLSTQFGAMELENYEASGVWGEDILFCTPQQLGIGVGIYHAILHNPEYDYLSIVFPLIVESASATQMIYPPNGSTITDPLPVFQWQSNPGVPYYLIGISDTPFTIEHDENGDTVITGIETVWQAITHDTALMYGMPDPSGYFEVNAPPLIPGQEYNWIIANNYGNDPLLTSKVAGSPFSFYYSAQETLPQPVLLDPYEGAYISSNEINFDWTEVSEAMYYQVQVFEIRHEGSNIGNYLVWDQVTTNTSINMNASSILIAADYVWKVYATSSTEVSSVSDAGHFSYDIATGTLALQVRDYYGSAVAFATAELEPIEGSSDNFPLAVNENGNETKILPVGQYILQVSKDGYEQADTVFTITEGMVNNLQVNMQYSPSGLYGRVTDVSGYNIGNVIIRAECENGEVREFTSINGSYLITVTSGEWTVSAIKQSWLCLNEQTLDIESGAYLGLSDIVMSESEKDIQGYVRNTNGIGLMRCLVTADNNGSAKRTISDAAGLYRFDGVDYGVFEIAAFKPGYFGSNEVTVHITPGSPSLTSVADLVLQPASMINGTARNGLVGLKQVTITAIPAMGVSIVTTTNEYGDYLLNLAAGTYNIGAHRPHYTNQTTYQVSLNTGETLDNLDFILIPNNGYITGTVTSEGDGIANVRISAGENIIYSDEAGDYELSVYPGTYTVSAYKQGYTINRDYRISLAPDAVIEDVNFILYPNAGIISGMIHHEGISIAAAEVSAKRLSGSQPSLTEISDANGRYSFSLLHGNYKLWAEKINFICLAEDTVFVTIAPGMELENIDINLTPVEAYIDGWVLNNQLLGIEGVLIEVINGNNYYSSISGNYGNFSVVVQPGYDYDVFASKSGYSSGAAQTGILEIGEHTDLEIILSQLPSTISGRVYNQVGSAIQGATVTAIGEETYSTTTNISGGWLMSIFAGSYQVTAAKAGYLEEMREIILVPGSLLDTLDFYLPENFASLEGYVVNQSTGEPLPLVMVNAAYINGGGNSGYTNQSGYYHLDDLLPGLYENIIYTKEGFYSNIVSNMLLPGNFTTQINISMEPFNSAIRSLVTYQGEGIAGATIAAENLSSGEASYGVTNTQGICQIDNLVSLQPYEVSVSMENYVASDTLVYPVPGDTLELSFDLIRVDGMIYGYIRNQQNNAVAAAAIFATSPDGYAGYAQSGANGYYAIEDLAIERMYEVQVLKQGYSQADTIAFYLTELPHELDIVIYEHIITMQGILIDQAGWLLPGIRVNCQSIISSDETFSAQDGSFILQNLAPFHNYTIWTTAMENGYESVSWQQYLEVSNLDLGEITVPVHISIIQGLITDADSGEPVAGAVITAENLASGHTNGAVSQPDGSYRIRYLYEGEYDLRAVKTSYAAAIFNDLSLGHREVLDYDFDMQYNAPLQISGFVLDTDSRPYEGVSVNMICLSGTSTVSTEIDGAFIFNQGLPYSEIVLTTDLPSQGYDNNWIEIITTTEDISGLLLEIDVHNAALSGVITDGDTALANVMVSITNVDTSLSMITGSSGNYGFNRLYEGFYELSAFLPGYELYSNSFSIYDDDIILENIVIAQLQGTISGIVGSAQEAALKNAVVRASLHGETVSQDTTHANGAFQLDGLPAGFLYQISVTKTGFSAYTYPDSVGVDEVPLQIELSPFINSLSGTVYYQGAEIAGATVVIREQNMEIQETIADEFGDYAFLNISGYRDVWAIYGDEFTSISEGVVVPAGGFYRFYPQLIEAASIEGITLYLGNLKPGVTVTATNTASGRWARDITEEDGLYELIGLAAGNYLITYYCEGYSFLNTPEIISLSEGEELVLPPVNMAFMQNSISGIVQLINTRIGISGASVVLSDSTHQVIDEFTTLADGTFLFSPLADGGYYVLASHPAYLEIDEIEVELVNGTANPATADFNLIPRDLNIFGYVRTDGNIPVNGAIVEISMQQELTSFGRNSAYRLQKRSYADTTDSSGYYEVTVDTTGFWQISATCNGFYPAQEVVIELNWDQSFYQQNIYLQPIILFADICGAVRIWDEGWQPPDSFSLNLYSQTGIEISQNFTFPDTLGCFESLVVPNVFELETFASYKGTTFYGRILDIAISEEQLWQEEFTFFYLPETFTWYGYISIQDDTSNPLSGAALTLISSLGDSLFCTSNNAGYYNFGNLEAGEYRLMIRAEYNLELFSHTTGWVNISENYNYNHAFIYYLCELGLYVRGHDMQPLPGSTVRITGENSQIVLTANHNGYCTTGAELHTGSYLLKTMPPQNGAQIHMAPPQQQVMLDTLGYYLQEINLPLWMQPEDYSQSVSFTAEIPVYLYKNNQYAGTAILYYRNVNQVLRQLTMYADENRFYQTIPAQNAAGEIEFWFTATTLPGGEVYSSILYPHTIQISAAGIPSLEHSAIVPPDPILPYQSQIIFTLMIKDELGNDLSHEILSDGSVIWQLENTLMGELAVCDDDFLCARFFAETLSYPEFSGTITAAVDYLDFHLDLYTEIRTGDYEIAELRITGPHEISNRNSAEFNVQIFSDNGKLLSLPFGFEPLPLYAGLLISDYSSIWYEPSENFLGRTILKVMVEDPQDGFIFAREFPVIVYDLINTNTQSEILFTGEGCELELYENMLKNPETQAKIYLLSQNVPPYEALSPQYETHSKIFAPNSNYAETAFNLLPGLRFEPEDNLAVARWDENELDWKILNHNSTLLPHIDFFAAHYSTIKLSDQLGIYGLRLSPNPFTPYDTIGNNKGLQIEFRLASSRSRYVSISARIYTFSGELVREIASNSPMLKGEYLAGDIATLYWDGYTDGGRMARNGRYLVHLIAEDSSDRKEIIKSIVLIK